MFSKWDECRPKAKAEDSDRFAMSYDFRNKWSQTSLWRHPYVSIDVKLDFLSNIEIFFKTNSILNDCAFHLSPEAQQ